MSETNNKPTIFITGATGYIAGTFLQLMLERDYLNRFNISALVRRPEDADKMEQFGVTPVIGTLDDDQLLRLQSTKADIVFNTANCDHRPSAVAIIKGLEERAGKTGQKPILVHTSGAGVLSDNSNGSGGSLSEDPAATIWDDADFEAHAAIPNHAPHRFVDVEVFAAARRGLIKTYLMVPPTVFGKGIGPFAANRMSIQIPRLVYHSLIARRVMYVGKGENQWTNVHVADLAELYLLVMNAAINDTAPEGVKGIYYPSSEYFVWSDVAHRIAESLYRRKILQTPFATTGLQRGWFWGSNVRIKCTNGEQLGWKPRHGGTKEMLNGIEWDAELMLRYLVMEGQFTALLS